MILSGCSCPPLKKVSALLTLSILFIGILWYYVEVQTPKAVDYRIDLSDPNIFNNRCFQSSSQSISKKCNDDEERIENYVWDVSADAVANMQFRLKNFRLVSNTLFPSVTNSDSHNNNDINKGNNESNDDEDINRNIERWEYGVPKNVAQKFIHDFAEHFNWTEEQKRINKNFPHQYIVPIAGLKLHFAAFTSSPICTEDKRTCKERLKTKNEYSNNNNDNNDNNDATKNLPIMLLLHGWPGSFLEFEKIIPLLSHSFQLIVPSIPGFGPSESSVTEGFDLREISLHMFQLIELIFGPQQKFFIQGGDWGSLIAQQMALISPDRILGLHLNFFPSLVPLPWGVFDILLVHTFPSISVFAGNEEDIQKAKRVGYSIKAVIKTMGYFYIQGTKPDTISYAFADSPGGWALWVLDKVFDWTDVQSYDELLHRFHINELLTDIALYYLTDSITSANRIYKENVLIAFDQRSKVLLPHSIPVGLSDFKGEIGEANWPEAWARSYRFPNLITYKRHRQGGHFAALEQTEVLASDILEFVNQIS